MASEEDVHRVQISFPKPEKPVMAYTPPAERGFGDPPPMAMVAYSHVGAYEGELWACDVCGSVVAKWPDDHPFINREGKDSFEVHAEWHRRILRLESRH